MESPELVAAACSRLQSRTRQMLTAGTSDRAAAADADCNVEKEEDEQRDDVWVGDLGDWVEETHASGQRQSNPVLWREQRDSGALQAILEEAADHLNAERRMDSLRTRASGQLETEAAQQRAIATRLRSEYLACRSLRSALSNVEQTATASRAALQAKTLDVGEQQMGLARELDMAKRTEMELRNALGGEREEGWRGTTAVGRSVWMRCDEAQTPPPPVGTLRDLCPKLALEVGTPETAASSDKVSALVLPGSWEHAAEEQKRLEQKCHANAEEIMELRKALALERTEGLETSQHLMVLSEKSTRSHLATQLALECAPLALSPQIASPQGCSSSLSSAASSAAPLAEADLTGRLQELEAQRRFVEDEVAYTRSQVAEQHRLATAWFEEKRRALRRRADLQRDLVARTADLQSMRQAVQQAAEAERQARKEVGTGVAPSLGLLAELRSSRAVLHTTTEEVAALRKELHAAADQQGVDLEAVRLQHEFDAKMDARTDTVAEPCGSAFKVVVENDLWERRKMPALRDVVGPDAPFADVMAVVARAASRGVVALAALYGLLVGLRLLASALALLSALAVRSAAVPQLAAPGTNAVVAAAAGAILAAALQSSARSVAAIATAASAGVLPMAVAVPMVLGVNVGASMTCALATTLHVRKGDEYRRSFACAASIAGFNALTLAVVLPIEAASGVVQSMSVALASLLDGDSVGASTTNHAAWELLGAAVTPVTSFIVQTNDVAIHSALGGSSQPLPLLLHSRTNGVHMFADTPLSDGVAGVLLLVVALTLVILVLEVFKAQLREICRGGCSHILQEILNLRRARCSYFFDWILLAVGAIATVVLHSFGAASTTLTLFAGLGLVSLERSVVLVAGLNVGAPCFMAAAFSPTDATVSVGLQLAFSHLLFNVVGVLVWFVLPVARRVPLALAKVFGEVVAFRPWLGLVFIIYVFLLLPCVILVVSFNGYGQTVAWITFLGLSVLLCLAVYALRRGQPLQEDAEDKRTKAEEIAALTSSSSPPGMSWPSGFVAWSFGWIALLALALAVPNAQWASLRYASFDRRASIGIGPWQACSEAFATRDVAWARAPPPHASCLAASARGGGGACAEVLAHACESFGGDGSGQSRSAVAALYQDAWLNCSWTCSPDAWKDSCASFERCHNGHGELCSTVAAAASFGRGQGVAVKYAPRSASSRYAWVWQAGPRCRQNACGSSTSLQAAGYAAATAASLLAFGEVLLLARLTGLCSGFRMLRAALAFLVATLLSLTIALSCFAAALRGATQCVALEPSGGEGVLLRGTLADIAGGWLFPASGAIGVAWLAVALAVTIALVRLRNEVVSARGLLQPKPS
eukprot:TRINITY_DN5344_c0_g1_i2.p1 TRINITY_DN5344_c0_g1~~TRINITY_DN5344_c0_g1_i2.p1  ORF type:complete len:1338 (-),score=280.92 TRINITY_DN5344_c0_g1_i2:171-4184(-)